jgi:two-component system response regulator FixJ
MATDATVTIIDDHAGIRDALKAVLQSHGWRVRTHALAGDFLDSYVPGLEDCLVVDINMPGLSGLELLETLGSRQIRIPVILMTGQADVPLAVRAMKAGAMDFLEKPFDDEALIASVQRAVTHGRRTGSGSDEAREATALLSRLTDRERQVLDHLALGKSNKVVAHDLGISSRTVDVHRAHLQEKLKAQCLADLVRIVRAAGQLS